MSFRRRKRHTYPPGFPRWLISTPLEEIEDTIGTDSFNKLIFKFMNETPKTRFFRINFSKLSSIGNLRSRLNILVEMMALPKTVFSIPNLTVSISGSSGKNLFIKMNWLLI